MLANQQTAVAFAVENIMIRGSIGTPQLSIFDPLESLIAAIAEVKGIQDSAVLTINVLLSRVSFAVNNATSLEDAKLAVASESTAFRSSASELADAIKCGG